MSEKLDSIETALLRFQAGGMIVVIDDETRKNEGGLICAADTVTSEQINFMARNGRGLICLSLPQEQINRLQLPLMSRGQEDGDVYGTAFTLSIDAKEGVTTGISAADRALTIRLACDPATLPSQVRVPGHVFPLSARDGGVFKRRGYAEASIDLVRLSSHQNIGGVICEIMKDDGTMMHLDNLLVFAKVHDLPIISVKDLVQYRLDREVKNIIQTTIPTPYGIFNQRVYHDYAGKEHVVLWIGDVSAQRVPLTRIHSECLTGDVFRSQRCDCGPQLAQSFERIGKESLGIIIYLRQEGRGIGLTEKMKAYALQDDGLDTVEANLALGHEIDLRTYDVALKMLQDLNVHKIRLLTNNPVKLNFVKQHGITVEQIPLLIEPSQYNKSYQKTKAEKLGHLIPIK